MTIRTTAAPAAVIDGSWSDLPEDILILIIDLIGEDMTNLFYFGSVCSFWQSVLQRYLHMYKPRNQMPWRLLQQKKGKVMESPIRFFNPTYHMEYIVDVPRHIPRQIVGYSAGFFGLVCNSSHSYRRWKRLLHIYNPITRANFIFPTIRSSRIPFVNFIVNTQINSGRCICAAFLTYSCFHGGRLIGVAKIGDKKWTYFNLKDYDRIEADSISDIIFHHNILYAITTGAGHSLVFDLNTRNCFLNLDRLNPLTDFVISHKIQNIRWCEFLESDENILFLLIVYKVDGNILYGHEVYRFDDCLDKWSMVENLKTQFFLYGEDNGFYLSCRWESNVPLRYQHLFFGHPADKFIVIINGGKESIVQLKIFSCNGDMPNRWFLPSFLHIERCMESSSSRTSIKFIP